MQVRALQGDPAAVSYWLARNMPGDAAARQALLRAPSPARRLAAIIAALGARNGGGRLLCRGCRREVLPRPLPHARSPLHTPLLKPE